MHGLFSMSNGAIAEAHYAACRAGAYATAERLAIELRKRWRSTTVMTRTAA